MSEKVSIITISFNSEQVIEKTIRSVLFQLYRPLEYVFVDGASKDNTVDQIKKYIPILEKKGIEVKFISEPDEGISDAFNKGIQLATGSIIGIINSDDQLADDAVEKIAKIFDSETDVVCGDCLWIDAQHGLQYIRKSKLELNKLKYEMVLMHPTCFVRKRAYCEYGAFRKEYRYVMDKELMARFYRKGAHFKYLPEVLAIMSAGGVSDANAEQVFQEGIEVAVENGVSRFVMNIRSKYKLIRLKLISFMKKNRFTRKRWGND